MNDIVEKAIRTLHKSDMNMYPSVGRPGIDVLHTRRLRWIEVTPYESLEYQMPSVCHHATVSGCTRYFSLG